MAKVNISKVVGQGYKDYWNNKKRYNCLVGSRASKKSKTTALWIIYNMMKYPQANTLVLRATYCSLKDSCYADLQWSMERLGVRHLWTCKVNPLEMVYKQTGQKILFRGFDNPDSLTSMAVSKGYLCWSWTEEAYQIKDEQAWNKMDLSFRGVPKESGLWVRHMLTLNPWSEHHWIKNKFEDNADEERTFFSRTTYRCNEFLNEDDIALFEYIERTNPRRARVECYAQWGISEGLVYDNWHILDFDKNDERFRTMQLCIGLDFGFTNDETALIMSYVDDDNKEIYIFDCVYKKGMLNTDIANTIKYKGLAKSVIIADGAEPKSIEELRKLGITRIKPAVKGQGSILQGIQKIQQYKIYVHSTLEPVIVELSNYAWDTNRQTGQVENKPVDSFNHALDALRYSIQCLEKPKARAISTFGLGI